MIDLSARHYAARTHDKMRDVLLDPTAAGAAVHYHMIRGGSAARNVTIWESGTVRSRSSRRASTRCVAGRAEVAARVRREERP